MALTQKRINELALQGLRIERERIDEEIHALSTHATEGAVQPVQKRRTMSAAARKRISDGMKRSYRRRAQGGR